MISGRRAAIVCDLKSLLFLFGLLGDAVGSHVAIMATAVTAVVILPLAIALARRLPAGEKVQ